MFTQVGVCLVNVIWRVVLVTWACLFASVVLVDCDVFRAVLVSFFGGLGVTLVCVFVGKASFDSCGLDLGVYLEDVFGLFGLTCLVVGWLVLLSISLGLVLWCVCGCCYRLFVCLVLVCC